MIDALRELFLNGPNANIWLGLFVCLLIILPALGALLLYVQRNNEGTSRGHAGKLSDRLSLIGFLIVLASCVLLLWILAS